MLSKLKTGLVFSAVKERNDICVELFKEVLNQPKLTTQFDFAKEPKSGILGVNESSISEQEVTAAINSQASIR